MTPLKNTSFNAGVGLNAAPLMVTVCPHAPVEGAMLTILGTPTLMATGVVGVRVVPEAAFTFKVYWFTAVPFATLTRRFVLVPAIVGVTGSVAVFVGPKRHVIPVGSGMTQLNVTEPVKPLRAVVVTV